MPSRMCFDVTATPVRPTARPEIVRLKRALRRVRLPERQRSGLGLLVPALLCGEESAMLVFAAEQERIGKRGFAASAAQLRRIAAEEADHGALLTSLRQSLPVPDGLGRVRRRSRRFLMRMAAAGGMADHFARIAELDGTVCIVLSELLAGPVGRHPVLGSLFRFIRADERRHVRSSRRYVEQLTGRSVESAPARAWVRSEVVGFLRSETDALEDLHMDPDVLFARLSGRVSA